MRFFRYVGVLGLSALAALSCNSNLKEEQVTNNNAVIKGLYSYGPEIRSFIDCEDGREYWVADSAKTLELAYTNLNFERPYEPVYIEAEGYLTLSDSLPRSASFDSTFVVTKLLKISKDIPEGPCK